MFSFDEVISREATGSLKWEKYKGKDIIPFWVADMDFVSAPEIIEALQSRLDHQVFGYTIPYESVEQSVIDYLKDKHDLAVEREWLQWIPGLVPALNVASHAFGEVEDEVLTCTPVYPPFLSAPTWRGKKIVTSALVQVDGEWTFDLEDLERKVSKRTKLFILCNPHNPVGRVYRKEELALIADFCERHDLVLCSDEIHCDMLYDDNKHIPIMNLSSRVAERTITLMAPSKTYNLPGLACSFAIIPDPKLRAAFKRVSRGFITEVNAFGYAGCEAAYRKGEPWRQALMEYLTVNRDYLYDFVKQRLPSIEMSPMEATYLAWLNVEKLQLKQPTQFFEDHGVGLSNGADFGDDRYVRLNFGCPRSVLEKGLLRMEKALQSLPH